MIARSENFKSQIKNRTFHKGFTLFEAVISIGLLLLVVSSFGGFVISVMHIGVKSESAREVEGNARMALDVLAQHIRSAIAVNDASSVWDVDPGILSLAMADATKNPTIIRLDHDDGALTIQEGTAAPVTLTSSTVKMLTLQFTRYTHEGGPGTIGIVLGVSSNSQSDAYVSYSDTFHTAVSLRK